MVHLVREMGGAHVDLFAATREAEAVAERLVNGGMPAIKANRTAARQAVSAALVRAIVAERPGARDALVSLWLDEVFRWCRFHAPRGVSAEDAAHDALLRMITLLPTLREPDRFGPWLWGLVWRVLKENQRRSWWRSWISPAPPPDGLEQQVHAAEREVRVTIALERLELEQRALLYLAYVEGIGRA
jgi:DNA-directed RNA polymerase specialized sigma24 family protein